MQETQARGTKRGSTLGRPGLPPPLTLEGIVVGLDALVDRLFQVSLLHTLNPQVLEAEHPPGISLLSQGTLAPPVAQPVSPPPITALRSPSGAPPVLW